MGQITQSRKRQIKRFGRKMTLSVGDKTCELIGYAPPPQASQLVEGVAKAAFIAQITADEVNAAGITPGQKMRLSDGPKSYMLTDATPVYDGQIICGWTLIAAGGAG
ncbi:MAG: hypothetical protein ABF746_08715 [Acetobacter orientalis]|uniref:hypothetical protein n=1 Tax=Acetobacter orientalis TaxID=146474 RepID=UPI0039E9B920